MGVLEGVSEDELLAIPDATLTGQLYPYMIWAGFDPEMGSVQALVESGQIGVVGDRQLRLAR